MDWTEYPVKMTGHQPYIVNASYTPTLNSIFINLGYLQKPFVDLDNKGIEYNLAQIGYTLGHEMSHGFDDMGSQYGLDGNLKDWWTPKDKAKFKSIQNNIIKQYNEFARRDGIDYDASISIGEDMADISGMNICEQYLKDYHIMNGDTSDSIKVLSYKEFYTYFAIQQRQRILKKAISAQLKTNPHPPDKYRCNIPLSRSDLFKGIYNVKKGNGMWWENSNQIW
jgi:putative endopeptidase